MKDNEINSVLIYQKQGIDMELAEIFHAVKSDYVAGLKNILRALITIVKDPKML